MAEYKEYIHLHSVGRVYQNISPVDSGAATVRLAPSTDGYIYRETNAARRAALVGQENFGQRFAANVARAHIPGIDAFKREIKMKVGIWDHAIRNLVFRYEHPTRNVNKASALLIN